MEALQELERDFNRRRGGVGELGPSGFVVGLDGGCVFSQGELGAYVGVEMAIGDVVDDLADSPSAIAIRCVKLVGRKAGDGLAHSQGKAGDLGDMAGSGFGCGIRVRGKM